MTSRKAIPVPSLESLAFIDQKFYRAKTEIDALITLEGDGWPALMKPEMVAAMEGLSTKTGQSLFEILQPVVDKTKIMSLGDLDLLILKSGGSHRLYFTNAHWPDDFTDRQLQAYLLHDAEHPERIDWRKFAVLYNESDDSQRRAIEAFLKQFKAISIEDLMDAQCPSLPVPDRLRSNKARCVDGQDQVFCELANEWLSDIVFHGQFMVMATITELWDDKSSTTSNPIAYAGTLSEALAKATAFVKNRAGPIIDPKTQEQATFLSTPVNATKGALTVYFQRKIVADSNLKGFVNIEGPTLLMSHRYELEWDDETARPFTQQQLRKTLWSVEKLLGVGWSKVRTLESDLGM
jgi:hypothetical protein